MSVSDHLFYPLSLQERTVLVDLNSPAMLKLGEGGEEPQTVQEGKEQLTFH